MQMSSYTDGSPTCESLIYYANLSLSLLSNGYQGHFPCGEKRPGRGADHSSSYSSEVKEWVEVYLPSPNTPSWRGAQLKKKKAQVRLYLRNFALGEPG
jgi:hypothetical protein